jgi:Tol biopolymer transport system component
VRIELEDALKQLESGEREEFGSAGSGRWAWAWPVVAGCFALTTLAGFGLWLTKPTAPNDEPPTDPEPVLQATTPTVLRVEQITDFPVSMRYGAISPDAATVIYAASLEGESADLYRLRIGGATPFRLTRARVAHENHPTISPNGESIAYWSAGDSPEKDGIFLMGATGESPRRIVEPPGFFPAWSPDGRSLIYTTAWWTDAYSRPAPGELWVVDLATRERRMIDTTDPAASADPSGWASDVASPTWSPDGTRIAYWGVRGGTRDIFTVSSAGGDVIRITDDAHTDWNPIWGPDGRSILFLSDRGGQSGIWSIALAEDGRPAGEPRSIVLGPGQITQVSRSADGRRMLALVVAGRELVERVRFDPEAERFVGSPELLLESSTAISDPDISPDGEWIAFRSAEPQEDVTVMRLDGTGRRRLTAGTAKDRGPRWSPDGKTLYYYSNENGDYEVWTVGRDTAEARVRPIAGVPQALNPLISPDGTRLAFVGDAGQVHIAKVAEDGSVLDARAVSESFRYAGSNWWSPDSRRICGSMTPPDGGLFCAVIDTETDTVTQVRKPDGDAAPWWTAMTWIDATRILCQSGSTEGAFVFDVVSGESRRVEDSPTNLGWFIAFQTDGWVYMKRDEESSNLWLVTLDGPGSE